MDLLDLWSLDLLILDGVGCVGGLVTNWVDKKAENNLWITPPEVTGPVHQFFPQGFLDPATEAYNPAGAKVFFTKEDNGLTKSWRIPPLGVFVNPPYSLTEEEKDQKLPPPIRAWTAKIKAEAAGTEITEITEILALLPCGARFSTKYFQDNILSDNLCCILFFRGRVKFIDGRTGNVGKGNNYDSMLLGFNLDSDRILRFFECFGHLGACFETIKLQQGK